MSFQADACNEAHELKEKLVVRIEVRFHSYSSLNNDKIIWFKSTYRGNSFPGVFLPYHCLFHLLVFCFGSTAHLTGLTCLVYLQALIPLPYLLQLDLILHVCTHITHSSRFSSDVISSSRPPLARKMIPFLNSSYKILHIEVNVNDWMK